MNIEFRMQNAECRMRRPASRVTHHASRKPQPAKRPTARSGVALVITLVLLSIITFMAVTFLVVSRSQHGSVATETDLAIARLAADSATERAIADLLAPIQAGTNEFNYSLRVSMAASPTLRPRATGLMGISRFTRADFSAAGRNKCSASRRLPGPFSNDTPIPLAASEAGRLRR